LLGKVDLVMWTKNGTEYLPIVLKPIDEIIPHENVCHKILVDDNSSDNTAKIAKDFNWTVYQNPYGGIPIGADEALRHVDCLLVLYMRNFKTLLRFKVEIQKRCLLLNPFLHRYMVCFCAYLCSFRL
jgi:hypothetical protein